MAKAMEEDGWRIIRPMSCCDRIGIKNGKVYFIEFKPAGNTKLRFYQKAVRKLVPDVYCVVVGSNDQNPKILGINDKWVGSPDFHKHSKKQNPLKPTTSKFRGVNWDSKAKKWRVRLMVKGKRVSIGLFDDEQDAGKAYDSMTQELYGPTACINFEE